MLIGAFLQLNKVNKHGPWRLIVEVSSMDIETELADIKKLLTEISRKLDQLIGEKEITAMMKLSEVSLKEFLEDEPSVYSINDVRDTD